MAEDNQENEEEWIPIRLREDEEMDFFTELALHEAERWIQAVTRKKFEYAEDFRKSLGNGILLCELLNCLKPGSVKRINKLPGAIAGLDNINVFLAACEKSFDLNKTHLFDPSDLEDLSTRAISDESEDFLKQEVDRRARNVAVTVYWLGKAVAGKYKGPALDASAFSALVHSHGNKNIISDDCFKNGSPVKENTSLTESSNHKHIRDSSYDSLGSYEQESESSFDELDSSGNLQGNIDMREMRRYNSTSSLSMSRDLRFSTASGDDGMYVSSPDLSQGSHAHTRSSSTDSMEGNHYGNHSRQSSGSTDSYATRRLSSKTRKTSTSTPDPLQFVKIKGAAELAEQAKKQMEVAKEVNMMRGKVDSIGGSEEPDWQSNFNNWKSRRKSAHARIGDDSLDEETEKKQHKTFSQIMAEKEKRKSLGPMSFYPTDEEDQKMSKKEKRRSLGQFNFYPVDDDDSGIGVKTRESPISKTTSQKSESKPKGMKPKSENIAPWAQDSSGEDNSQSDSETNNSHQSGDTDSVFSDKSTPSKVLSDDDSWMKNKSTAQPVSSKLTPPPKTQRSLGDSVKLWENSSNESQKKDSKIRDLPTNSAKIKNITQAFEQKDKEANAAPVITKRSEYNRGSLSKSLDLTDHSYTKPFSLGEKQPTSPLSPTAPKALTPRDQRYSHGNSSGGSPAVNNVNKRFTEQTIKINQKPNNDKGFGFSLVGGSEKKQPVTVQRVSLGSAAEVCQVEAYDELVSVNGRDVTNLTLAQVQGIVDHSVKRGQIELRIKRYFQEDGYDSMEDNAFTDKPSVNNKMDTLSGSELNADNSEDTNNYRPAFQVSTKTEERPRLMDQLREEHKRETNNNEKNQRPPSPVATESFRVDINIGSQSVPLQQTTAVNQTLSTNQDMSAPEDVILTEERSTISVRKSPISTSQKADESPVQMRQRQAPLVQESPPPPTPPKTELPPLAKYNESPGVTTGEDSSGFGPPAALLRWQRPRPKSEYQSSVASSENQVPDRTKRLSATLPFKSDHPFTLDKDYSKDDSMLEKVSKDFMESVSVSKPVESKVDTYQFNDSPRIEDWQQKQERKRLPEQHSSTPPIEFSIHQEEHLTAQSAAPTRKQAQVDAPNLMEINVPNNSELPTLSPQEKFERDQQRIRMQYEEEKRRAREAEKHKQEQEQQTLNSDKFLRNMESQILQTKQEAASHNLINEPIRSTVTQPRFSSEPMTIKLPSNSQGRQLVIDPRNQSDRSDSVLPEYSFKVDLPKTESGPPLRTLKQQELSREEILAQEREKIREEEKRKFEVKQQRWKEQQERELREQKESIERERERLQREQEEIEREKALLEQKARLDDSFSPRYQPVSNHIQPSPRSSAGSAGSSLSQSPRSPPPALDPKYRDIQSRKAPPPTAPKPERGPQKARLTREDLLAMNRKATPLARPDPSTESGGDKLDNSLSPTTREPPSKGELHSLNAVPKPKFHSSAAWIKEKDSDNNMQNEKPFVIGKRADLIHQRDYSNPSDHWLVREAEKRRLAEKSDYANIESVTAHAGPTKPSQSSLVSRFRGDVEPPPRSNRYSYPSSYNSDSRLSPTSRPLSATTSSLNQYNRSPEQTVTQFSAKTQPNSFASNPALSQTLPPNFSFNANVRNQDSMPSKPPRSLTDDSGPLIAVSGKQKCSHCGEELGFGAAMVIESLGLYYHVQCFRCCVCRTPLGNGSEGTDVRVRVNKLHCKNCYSNDEAGLKFSKV